VAHPPAAGLHVTSLLTPRCMRTCHRRLDLNDESLVDERSQRHRNLAIDCPPHRVLVQRATHARTTDDPPGMIRLSTYPEWRFVERRYVPRRTILCSVNERAVKAKIPREYLPALVVATCYMRTLTNLLAAGNQVSKGTVMTVIDESSAP
jgi:hypothetical protein